MELENGVGKSRILLVEDDDGIRKVMTARLKNAGFNTFETAYGLDAVEKIDEYQPDLIVLDLGLPDSDGLDICRQFKTLETTRHIPVVIVTGRARIDDEIKGLGIGADDFVRKPFDGPALILRIKKALDRREHLQNAQSNSRQITVGDLQLFLDRQMISINGENITLTRTEFCLLTILTENRGEVVTRDQLTQSARKFSVVLAPGSMNVYINRLRKKLGRVAHYVETIHKLGYRLAPSQGE